MPLKAFKRILFPLVFPPLPLKIDGKINSKERFLSKNIKLQMNFQVLILFTLSKQYPNTIVFN